MDDKNPILWILGAGATKHLDLPLLCEFRSFIDKIAKYPDNQEQGDAEGRCASFRTLNRLSEKGVDDNIETLLQRYGADSEEGADARHCVRWCFEKRHYAVMHKRNIPYKYKAYSYFLCCVQPIDTIVTFNYDLSIERAIMNARRTDREHREEPRIPEECLSTVKNTKLELLGVESDQREGAKLVKIHGSLSFAERCGQLVVGTPLHEAVDDPYIVYPAASKPGMKHGIGKPLLDAAITELDKAQHIIIVGYSLPDSDAEKHPFVSQLLCGCKSKRLTIISPAPKGRLLDLAKDASKSMIWVDKFENVFSQEHVRDFGDAIGRTPALG